VNDDFSAIFELLEHSGKEVTGRAAPSVSVELQQRLAKFAAGQSDETERRELLTMLEQQPDLVPALVKAIKNLRDALEFT
jgi:hypothetical protein